MSAFANWLIDLVKDSIAWFFGVLGDWIIAFLGMILDGVLYLLGLLPVPDFLTTHSLNSLYSSLNPGILYFVDVFNVPECIALVGLGFGFRMMRKLFTLGQW